MKKKKIISQICIHVILGDCEKKSVNKILL